MQWNSFSLATFTLLFLVTAAAAQNPAWRGVPSPTTYIQTAQFISASIGWVTNEDSCFLTTNGGDSWKKIVLPRLGRYRSFGFLNDSLGFSSSDSIISKTTDGGNTWTNLTDTMYATVKVRPGGIIFLYGRTRNAGPAILFSTDAGQRWESRTIPTDSLLLPGGSVSLLDVALTGPHHLFVTYYWLKTPRNSYGGILLSTDGGSTWSEGRSFPGQIWDLCFADSLLGYGTVVWPDYNRQFMRTLDGGRSWEELRRFGQWPHQPSCFGKHDLWVFTPDAIIHTADEGISQDTVFRIPGVWFSGGRSDSLHGWTSTSDNRLFLYGPSTTGVTPDLPRTYQLEQNFPNPFNPQTSISYTLPVESFVTLTVYNVLGQQVAMVVNEKKQAGTHTVSWNAANQPSGLYFYKLSAGKFSQVRKMLLVQ